MEQDFIIRHDRRPGDDALIAELHVRGYADHGERFQDAHFIDHVGATVAEAGLEASPRNRVWFVERGGETLGCTAMIDRGREGQLRWVILLPEARGHGLGRKLVEGALAHARACGWPGVFLETTDGLDASMSLYRSLGFEAVSMTDSPEAQPYGHHIVMRLTFSN